MNRTGHQPLIAPRIIALRGLPDEDQAQRLRRDLPEAEWQWITRLRQPQDRLRSLLGRALARRLLASRLNLAPERIPLATGPHGKPLLAASFGWHFSIAHSGDQVLAAVGPQALGVDVERCPERVDSALFRYVTGRAPEQAGAAWRVARNTETGMAATNADADADADADAQAFCVEWVRREAVLKACGLGLTIGPGTLSLRALGRDWHRVDGPPEARGLHVRLLESPPGYRAALCLPAPRDDWQLTRLALDAWLNDPKALV